MLTSQTHFLNFWIYFFFSVVEKAEHFQVWIKHYKTEHEKPYALGMEQIQQSHDGDDPATSCLLNPSQIAPSLLEISMFPPLNTLPSIQHQARNKTAVSKSLLAPRPFSTLQSQIHDGWKRPLRSSSPTISPPHHAHWPCPSVLHLYGSWAPPGMVTPCCFPTSNLPLPWCNLRPLAWALGFMYLQHPNGISHSAHQKLQRSPPLIQLQEPDWVFRSHPKADLCPHHSLSAQSCTLTFLSACFGWQRFLLSWTVDRSHRHQIGGVGCQVLHNSAVVGAIHLQQLRRVPTEWPIEDLVAGHAVWCRSPADLEAVRPGVWDENLSWTDFLWKKHEKMGMSMQFMVSGCSPRSTVDLTSRRWKI